jgi:hypothetical protein
MSLGSQWSGRWSDRVDTAGENHDVRSGVGPDKTPERLASLVAAQLAPEGSTEGTSAGPGKRVSRRQMSSIEKDLSDRERAILRDLDRFRFLTTGQLQRLHFTFHATSNASGRICRRVLARLAEQRVIEHLERRIGGIRAGSASYVWRVGPVGDRLLRQARGEGARRRRKEPSRRHLEHCLAIADCYVALVEEERRGHLSLMAVETEPDCWRQFLGSGGTRETLKPDLYVVTASGEYEDHWFLEVDRGTESLPTLLSKCTQYDRARRTGRLQADTGVFPLVLWLLPDERRLHALNEALRSQRRIDTELFRLTTADHLVAAVAGGAV